MKAKITEQGVLVLTAETKEDVSNVNKWIKHHRQVYDYLPIMAESVVSGDDKSSKALHKQNVMVLLPDEKTAMEEAQRRFCDMAEKEDVMYGWQECFEYMTNETLLNEKIYGNKP